MSETIDIRIHGDLNMRAETLEALVRMMRLAAEQEFGHAVEVGRVTIVDHHRGPGGGRRSFERASGGPSCSHR